VNRSASVWALNRVISGLEVLLQCVSAGEMVAVMQALTRPFSEYGGKFPHMLVALEQKSSLRLYFSQNKMVATPIFGSVISLDRCLPKHMAKVSNGRTGKRNKSLYAAHVVLIYLVERKGMNK